MDNKSWVLFLFLVAFVAADGDNDDLESGSNEGSPEEPSSSVEQSVTEISQNVNMNEPDPYKAAFINKVHSIASEVSRNLVIHDNKVVWSPFVVVNAMAQLRAVKGNDSLEDQEKLLNGFKSAITYLTYENPLNSTLISVGYTRNGSLLTPQGNYTGLSLNPLEREDVDALLQETFLNLTDFGAQNNNSEATDSSPPSTPSSSNNKFNASETILLTGLGVSALWANPFHPRYAKKSRFYLNSTHVVKAKIMNNIGFYKYADLPELDASGVAMPLRDAPKSYFIFIKPNNPDNIESLNTELENVSNFTEIFKRFRTKRVQLSLPRVDIDSQFPIYLPNNISTLHVSSLKLSYTGAYNNFHAPVSRYRPVRFHRLKRRPDDAKMRLNSPFLFHLYDDNFSGILLSGMILNPELDVTFPIDMELVNNSSVMLPQEIRYEREISNQKCLKDYEAKRKGADIYEDLMVQCTSQNENYTKILQDNGNSSYVFEFTAEKLVERKFYRNEVDHVNTTFGEVVMKVKYASFGELFDGKMIKITNDSRALYIFYPNERSGLHAIEEALSHVPLSSLTCQMRDITLRLRIPDVPVVTRGDGTGIRFGIINKSDTKNETDAAGDLVEIERQGRGRRKNKRFRKLNLDRPFLYIVTEEGTTQGGFVTMGRVVRNQKVTK